MCTISINKPEEPRSESWLAYFVPFLEICFLFLLLPSVSQEVILLRVPASLVINPGQATSKRVFRRLGTHESGDSRVSSSSHVFPFC